MAKHRRGVSGLDPAAAAAKRKRIEDQADAIAELLGIDPEQVMLDPGYGVSLTVDQADQLIGLARDHADGVTT
jgi:hypothetical protein